MSQTLTTLLDANSGAGDWHIAVRGGGHNQWAGSNNIQNGVTIDLGFFNQTTYNETTGLVSVGPGGKWGAVFADINENYGVTVAGGRDGDVGVGGFLLGNLRLPFHLLSHTLYSGRSQLKLTIPSQTYFNTTKSAVKVFTFGKVLR